MVKKEMSSHSNYRETFWEIAFWWVTSSHRVPPFPSWNTLLTLLSWILQSDIWEPIGDHGEKGSILTQKLEIRFLRDCSVMYDFITQRSPLPSWNSLLTLLSWILQSDIWEPIGDHCEKGGILIQKLERRFLRDCFPMYDFITQRSPLPFLEQFDNTVVVDSAKWYLGTHWGVRLKSKYRRIKTGKKPSEKLHCHVWMQFADLHVSLQWSVC